MTPTKHASTNYRRIYAMIPELIEKRQQYKRYESAGFMPLSFDFLTRDDKGRYIIAMAHNGVQNGDLMADPDMEIALDPLTGTAEPLTFQNDYLGLYQQVYIEHNGQRLYSKRLRTDLDEFLYQWLNNIEHQDYVPASRP